MDELEGGGGEPRDLCHQAEDKAEDKAEDNNAVHRELLLEIY